jgi:hypothetical protein
VLFFFTVLAIIELVNRKVFTKDYPFSDYHSFELFEEPLGIMNGLQAIRYTRGRLEVLDQLKLPHEFIYDNVSTCEEAFDCIRSMRVRGELPTGLRNVQKLSIIRGAGNCNRGSVSIGSGTGY